MNQKDVSPLVKPLLRGHFHQAAFFFALGACSMLIANAHGVRAVLSMITYSLGVVGLFGVSALYHRPNWQPTARTWMKRLDHAAIFVMIAATGTPIAALAMTPESGKKFLGIIWIAAIIGVIQSLFWVKAPKWISAILYVTMGWLAVPYISEMREALGFTGVVLLLIGGVIYTVGAVIYAAKKPNPWPTVFGYHEIFHLLTILAATFHFLVIAALPK